MINSWLESKEALPIITVAGRKTCILGKGEETQLSPITTLEHTLSLMQGHVHKGPGMSHGESSYREHQSRQRPRSQKPLALPLVSSNLFSVILSRKKFLS